MSAPTPNRPAPHPGGGAALGQPAAADAHRRGLGIPGGVTYQQRRVLDTEGVVYVGTDAKGRPVVEALVGIPNTLRTWAVLRNGDPTEVTQPVALAHRAPEPEQCAGGCGGVFCPAVRAEQQQRLAITVVVLVAAGTDPDAAGGQVFDMLASDPLDLAPLVLETEGYNVERW